MNGAPTVMITPLGGQPQVVTFALDLLLARGEPINALYVLHLSLDNGRTRQSLAQLAQEFNADQYAGQRCRFRRVPIHSGGVPLYDIRSEREAEAVWQCVRELIADLKQQGCKLHICISGGRRLLGLLSLSAAALLCDHQDRVWHIYTPDDLRTQADGGALMHVQPDDGVQLIQVPLVPWGAYFPALRAMATAPAAAVAQQMGWLTTGSDERCQQVYEQLSERQRDTLIAFAQGFSPQDVAETLNISLHTVYSHRSAILAECRIAWQMDDQTRLDYRFLREHFPPFLRRIRQL